MYQNRTQDPDPHRRGGALRGANLQAPALEYRNRTPLEAVREKIRSDKKVLSALPTWNSRYEKTSVQIIDGYSQLLSDRRHIPTDLESAIKFVSGVNPGIVTALHPFSALTLSRCYSVRYERENRTSDLDDAINSYSKGLNMLPEEHQFRFTFLKELGDNFGYRFDRDRKLDDATGAIESYREAGLLHAHADANKLRHVFNGAGRRLLARSRLTGGGLDGQNALYGQKFHFGQSHYDMTDRESDVQEAISFHQRALELESDGGHHEALRGLALCYKQCCGPEEADKDEPADGEDDLLLLRFAIKYCLRAVSSPWYSRGQTRIHADILASLADRLRAQAQDSDTSSADMLIELEERLLKPWLYQSSSDFIYTEIPGRPKPVSYEFNKSGPNEYTLESLAFNLDRRYKRTRNISDLNLMIEVQEQLLRLHRLDSSVVLLRSLSLNLHCRFKQTEQISDLDRVVELKRRLLSFYRKSDPEYEAALESLSSSMHKLSELKPNTGVVNQAVEVKEELLSIRSKRPDAEGDAIESLVISLSSRHGYTEDTEDLNRCIELLDRLLRIRPHGSPHHARALHNQFQALYARFTRTGYISDLDRAIELEEQVVQLGPEGHPLHGIALQTLALGLESRFQETARRCDLDTAIELRERFLRLAPGTANNEMDALSDLSRCLLQRIAQSGDPADLNRVVELNKRTLDLCPEDHDGYVPALKRLSDSLFERFSESGDISDLDRAIILDEKVLEQVEKVLVPPPDTHNYDVEALERLARSLQYRFAQNEGIQDLNRVIELQQQILDLSPGDDSDKADLVIDLATSLSTRVEQVGDKFEDVKETIKLWERVLDLRPTNPNSYIDLADSLDWQRLEDRNIEDIERAIKLREKALEMCPPGHPGHAFATWGLAKTLSHQWERNGHTSDVENSETTKIIGLYRGACGDVSASVLHRLRIAVDWPVAAKRLNDRSAMEAHITILRLLETFVAQSHSLRHRCVALVNTPAVRKARRTGVDAAALAVAGGRTELAVRFLEQGRSVVLQQLGHLQTQVEDITFVHPKLGERFKDLSKQLKALATGGPSRSSRQPFVKEGRSVDEITYRAPAEEYATTSKEWLEVTDQIRGIYGFQSFLQPPSFDELQQAADAGPIILVNISATRSDAIVMAKQVDRPTIVPLPEATPSNMERLADAFGKGEADLSESQALRLLRELWKIVVQPIAQALENSPFNLKRGSRIWWCPTGDAARLPLHAAGPYKTDERGMLNLYTSSYVSNLGALIRARKSRRLVASPSGSGPTILLVGQGRKKGEAELPGAVRELLWIEEHASKCTSFSGERALKKSVVSALETHAWVHLACHGYRNDAQPFSSYFSLHHDDRITLLDLIQTDLPNAELAVLSACHSAGTNKNLPDEFLHPAAVMMMAGFKSIVGTMWALDDEVGPMFAEKFYEEMLPKDGTPKDVDHAAVAMRKAVRSLGEEGVPLLQRINFVHFGI